MRRTPRGYATLGGEPEQAERAGAADVGAAAELDRVAHLHHAHHVAVLVGEERHGPQRERVGIGHLSRAHGVIGPDRLVDVALDQLEGRRLDRAVVREVEAKPLVVHQRALLADVGAQMPPQRRVHQVRGAVIPLDVVAALAFDLGHQGRRLEARPVVSADHHAALVLAHRVDPERPALTGQRAGVADLTAGFGVERILVEDELHPIAVLPEGQRLGLGEGGVVADEFLPAAAQHVPLGLLFPPWAIWSSRRPHRSGPPRGPRPLPLLLQGPRESGSIHGDSPLTGDQLGEIHREAVGVVELEGLLPGDHLGTGREELLQPGQPAFDRAEESHLFRLGPLPDVRLGSPPARGRPRPSGPPPRR